MITVRYPLTRCRPPNDAWIRASRLRRTRSPRISVVLRGLRSCCCGAVGLQVLVVRRAAGGAGLFPVIAVSAVAGGCSARSYFGAGRDGDTGRVPGGAVFLGGADRPSAVHTGLFAEPAVSFVCSRPRFRIRRAPWCGPSVSEWAARTHAVAGSARDGQWMPRPEWRVLSGDRSWIPPAQPQTSVPRRTKARR